MTLWARGGCKLTRRGWQASLTPHAASDEPAAFFLFRRVVPGDDGGVVRQPFTLGTANRAASKILARFLFSSFSS